MLVEFTVNNFKSLKDDITLSMVSSPKDDGNYFEVKKYKLLKSAVIYGSNASGKSNFLKAISFMCKFVLNKYKIIQSTDPLPYEPFKLSSETDKFSSSFEIIFFIEEVKYRYGFEIDNEVVYSEWLYEDIMGKEAKLFYRDLDGKEHINPSKFKEGYSYFISEKKTINISKNMLFIWKCDQENGKISRKILNWFSQINNMSEPDNMRNMDFTVECMKDDQLKKEIMKLIQTADIGIDDIAIKEGDYSVLAYLNKPLHSLITTHKKFNENGKIIDNVFFDFNKEESDGTKKLFSMSAPILHALKYGKILIVDELDSSLHPLLTQHLVNLFYNEEINVNNAQLIFTTHDINLLKNKIFERGQIWLSEKDKYGATNLSSLAEFKNVRKEESFEKKYIQGKYGAIPYIGKFEL